MEVWIAPVWFRDKIPQPLDGIIWLFVIAASFLHFPLLDDWCEKISRSGVAFPDGSKFGDEVLYDGTKPGMEEPQLCGGEKYVFRVLRQVSEQTGWSKFVSWYLRCSLCRSTLLFGEGRFQRKSFHSLDLQVATPLGTLGYEANLLGLVRGQTFPKTRTFALRKLEGKHNTDLVSYFWENPS